MKKSMAIYLAGVIFAASAGADSVFMDKDLQLLFPAEIGDLSYDRTDVYNDTSLGYSVFYEAENFTAEVQVFMLGRDQISDGPEAEGIDVVLEGVQSVLEQEKKFGQIGGLRERGSKIVPSEGDIRFSNRVYEYVQQRKAEGTSEPIKRLHSVYATGWRNHFVKVELKFDLSEGTAARQTADELLKHLIGAMQERPTEDELLVAACEAQIRAPSSNAGRLAAQHVLSETKVRNIGFYPHLFVWPDGYWKPKNAELLEAAYFAGALKAMIKEKDETGGYGGFVAILKAYETLRKNDEIESIIQLDEWLEAEDRKALYDELLMAPE